MLINAREMRNMTFENLKNKVETLIMEKSNNGDFSLKFFIADLDSDISYKLVKYLRDLEYEVSYSIENDISIRW